MRPCFVAFDLVYLNGECIITQAWYVRRQLLASVFTPVPGRLKLVPVTYGRTVDDLTAALDAAIADRCVAHGARPSLAHAVAWTEQPQLTQAGCCD
jgi:ATP-dependent DNA ligase